MIRFLLNLIIYISVVEVVRVMAVKSKLPRYRMQGEGFLEASLFCYFHAALKSVTT